MINGLSVIKPVVLLPILMMYLAFLATNPITSTKYLTSCDSVALIESVWRCSVNLSIHPHHFNAESVYNLMFIYVHCIGTFLLLRSASVWQREETQCHSVDSADRHKVFESGPEYRLDFVRATNLYAIAIQ